MLAIARALTQSPRLLILDEPTEGLAPIVVESIARIVHSLKGAGLTMLLVEQNYPFAVGLSERVYVLGKGRVRWEGSPAALEASPEVDRDLAGGVEGARAPHVAPGLDLRPPRRRPNHT